jgi:hypothetical protein
MVAITAQKLAVIDGGSISSAFIGNATGAGGKAERVNDYETGTGSI